MSRLPGLQPVPLVLTLLLLPPLGAPLRAQTRGSDAPPGAPPEAGASMPAAARSPDDPLPRRWPMEASDETDPERLREHWKDLFPDYDALHRAMQQALQIPEYQEPPGPDASRASAWEEVGSGIWLPNHTIPDRGIFDRHLSGRVTSLRWGPDPEYETVLYLGASGGGVWRRDETLARWVPLSDNLEGPPSVGSFLVHRENPNRIIVGTGDGTGDGAWAYSRYPGDGLYRTIDHGSSWGKIVTMPDPEDEPHHTFAIEADLYDPDLVLVATSRGIWRSPDFGASGSWVLPGQRVTDLSQDPGDASGQRWLAGVWGEGVYVSTDGGASWAPINGDGGTGLRFPIHRVALEFSHSEPSYVFALVSGYGLCSDPDTGAASDVECHGDWHCELHDPYTQCVDKGGARLNNVYRSSDRGSSWVPLEQMDKISNGFADIFMALGVDPESADRVFVGMVNLQWTENATESDPLDVTWHRWRHGPGLPCDEDGDGTIDSDWPATASCDLPQAHADHAVFLFRSEIEPGSSVVHLGGDGGHFSYDHAANTTSGPDNHGWGLNISQTMQVHGALGGSWHDPDLLLAGLQDNGLVRIDKSAPHWMHFIGGGDGGQSQISPRDPDDFFFSSGAAFNRYYSTDQGDNWWWINCDFDHEWTMTVMTDPSPTSEDPLQIFTYAGDYLWHKSFDPTCNWQKVNPGHAFPADFKTKHFDIATDDTDEVFYVTSWSGKGRAHAGEDRNDLLVMDGGSLGSMTWVDRKPPEMSIVPPSNWKDCTAFADKSMRQRQTVYYTTATSRPSRAFISLDDLPGRRGKGIEWWEVTGSLATDLPDADYYELVANPSNPNQMFLATNVGVFITNDGLGASPTWWRYMTGLPSVISAMGIELNDDNSPTGAPILHIGSYGRGFWERRVVNTTLHGGYIPGTLGVSGLPLRVGYEEASGEIALEWTPSCAVGDTDYAVYEGELGSFGSHVPVRCGTGGATRTAFQPGPVNAYYLVAPIHADPQMPTEGATGRGSNGADRPQGQQVCYPRDVRGCS